MENESKSRRYCPNCYYPIEQNDHFCGHCGQRYTTGKIPLKELFQEFFESVLNIDAKIFRTIGALFIPGKLTIEYFKGRHNSYFRPLRIFFVIAVILFAIISLSDLDKDSFNFMDSETDQRKQAHYELFLDQLDSAKVKVLQEQPNSVAARNALDSLSTQFKDTRRDSIPMGYLDFKSDWTIESKEFAVTRKEAFETPEQELFEKYKINGFFEQIMVRQWLKLISDNESFSQYLFSKMIWMIILMMPVLALIMKLLYIRRKRYYVEHLVFAFHTHAFAFLLAIIAVLILDWNIWQGNDIEEKMPIPFTIAFFIIMIYLFISLKKVYGQGFFKTFIKYSILNFSYLIIFVVFLTLTFVISALLF